MGFIENYNKPFTFTSKLIEYLEDLGALISCKGNIPQARPVDRLGRQVSGWYYGGATTQT